MLPFLLIVAAVGIDRLLLSDRWRLLDPVRRGWRVWRPRTIAYVRSAPATYVYLAVLFLTSWILETSSSRVADALLQERSTNLHHLARDPLRVLLSSAFWVGSLRDWLAWVVLLSVFAAPVERWIGTSRTVLVFFIGHVGATLVTAAGLWVALRSDLVEPSVVNARDVGASYGAAAVAAVLTYRIGGRPGRIYAGALVAFAGTSLAFNHNFTYWGHLIAVVIGLACYPLASPSTVVRSSASLPRRPAERHDAEHAEDDCEGEHRASHRAASAVGIARRQQPGSPDDENRDSRGVQRREQ